MYGKNPCRFNVDIDWFFPKSNKWEKYHTSYKMMPEGIVSTVQNLIKMMNAEHNWSVLEVVSSSFRALSCKTIVCRNGRLSVLQRIGSLSGGVKRGKISYLKHVLLVLWKHKHLLNIKGKAPCQLLNALAIDACSSIPVLQLAPTKSCLGLWPCVWGFCNAQTHSSHSSFGR